MTAPPRDFDVLVAGCGPVGATVAALLGNAGLSVLVVEPDHQVYRLPRAVAIDDDAMRILQTVPGLAERVSAAMIVSPKVEYTTFGGAQLLEAEPRLAATPSGHSALSLFHQPSFEVELQQTLNALPTVAVERGSRLESFEQHADGITATVSGPNPRQVSAGWLLGCDGASSKVRKAIGAEFEGSTFEQPWVVADVFVDPADEGQPLIEFICDPARPIVTMPMPGGRRRWEFMLLPGESHQAMLESSRLDQLIRDSGWSGTYEVERAVIYTFHARMANTWGSGRVFLLGDAAHVMPPFAGQGMNSGIRDAGNIWWKLAAVERGAAGPVLLDSYEQERRDHVKQMMDLAVRLGGIIQTVKPGVAKLRDAVIKAVMLVPGARAWTLRLGWKPDSVIRAGWMVGGRRRARSLVGTQLPAAQVKTADGIIGLDEAIGTSFAVVSKAPDPWAALDQPTRAMLEQFGAVALTLSNRPAGTAISVAEDSLALRKWIKRARGGTVVVRPDRFAYGVFS